MKKTILLITFLFVTLLLFSQDSKLNDSIAAPEIELNDEGNAVFQFIIEQEGAKDDLYVAGLSWLASTYKSGKSVIEVKDKEGGLIMGNARTKDLYTKVPMTMGKHNVGHFRYSITLNFKDGKYRCIIDNITYENDELILAMSNGADYADDYPENWPKTGTKFYKKKWAELKELANNELLFLYNNLYKFMQNKPKTSDW